MIATAALILFSATASPAETAVVGVGSRVRIFAPEVGGEPVIGRVVNLEAGALVVQGADGEPPKRVVLGPTTRIDVSGGRTSKAGRGALLGVAFGAAPGLLMTFGDYNSDPDVSPGYVALVGAAGGAAVGAAIGWAIKSEKWLPAKAPQIAAGIAPVRGGFGFSLRVAWGKD